MVTYVLPKGVLKFLLVNESLLYYICLVKFSPRVNLRPIKGFVFGITGILK